MNLIRNSWRLYTQLHLVLAIQLWKRLSSCSPTPLLPLSTETIQLGLAHPSYQVNVYLSTGEKVTPTNHSTVRLVHTPAIKRTPTLVFRSAMGAHHHHFVLRVRSGDRLHLLRELVMEKHRKPFNWNTE